MIGGLDLATVYNYTIEVKKLHIYFVDSVILYLDAILFYLFIICLLIMSICVCVNRTIDGDLCVVLDGISFWADWHHCMLYSTHHSRYFGSLLFNSCMMESELRKGNMHSSSVSSGLGCMSTIFEGSNLRACLKSMSKFSPSLS